jgi:hypothetical protein
MTTLKGIKGDQIRYLDQDPVVQGIAGGTWSSGENLPTGRAGPGAFGIQTAAVVFGGEIPAVTNTADSYNGTSWSSINSMNVVGYRTAGLGTQSAGKRVASGPAPFFGTAVEDFDGTNWTTGTSLTTARAIYNAGGGTQTASIVVSGFIPSTPFPTGTTANVESWNGSTWTEVADVNSARIGSYSGTNTEGILASGANYNAAPSITNVTNTEIWNGTSWTEVAEVNFARRAHGSSGTSTSSIIFSGVGPASTITNTEYYDGTSWTEVNDVANGIGELASTPGSPAGTAIKIGGSGPSALTEEWTTNPTASIALQEGMLWFNSTSQTLKGYGLAAGIPSTSWASGGNMNVGNRNFGASFGTQSAALESGGDPIVATTELYNGSAWTEVNDMNTGRQAGGSGGTQTSGIVAGGNTPPGTTATESWDGTNWTTSPATLNNARFYVASAGTETALIMAGGENNGPALAFTETFNGTSWTEVADLNTARAQVSGAGIQTSALAIGGSTPPFAWNESWNGTSWTETTDMNTARYGAGAVGSSNTEALVFGGYSPAAANGVANTEVWNGTSWTELNDLSGARFGNGRGGTTALALTYGGYFGANLSTTEEWTATAAVATITTS